MPYPRQSFEKASASPLLMDMETPFSMLKGSAISTSPLYCNSSIVIVAPVAATAFSNSGVASTAPAVLMNVVDAVASANDMHLEGMDDGLVLGSLEGLMLRLGFSLGFVDGMAEGLLDGLVLGSNDG